MKPFILILLLLSLIGCNNDKDNTVVVEVPAPTPTPEPPPPPPPAPNFKYQIQVFNLTQAQPFSPVGALLHDANFHAWEIGSSASTALEQLAEGGDVSTLINSQVDKPQHISAAPLGPGAHETFEIMTSSDSNRYLTLATMLVNTNDAFSGVTGLDLKLLAVGESIMYHGVAYDAGSENNSELSGTMPGPADGGEGFNATRDDVNSLVTHHSGVVGREDSFSSVLSEAHRFDNPVLQLIITRL